MKKLTVIAAAFAAGLASFAQAQENVAQTPAALGKTAKTKKNDKASADKCQYLFSCNQVDAVGKKPGAKVSTKTAEAAKEQPSGKKNRKAVVAKADAPKAKSRKGRTKVTLKKDGKAIDLVTTASVGGADSLVVKTVATSGSYHAIIARYAGEYGVPVSLAHAVITVESNYRPNTTGSAGEVGLMQIKPATARMMGYSGSVKGLYNPETNIKFGMKYLSMAQKLGGGTTCGTILKYNAGHAAKRMNPVSSAYCSKVKRLGA